MIAQRRRRASHWSHGTAARSNFSESSARGHGLNELIAAHRAKVLSQHPIDLIADRLPIQLNQIAIVPVPKAKGFAGWVQNINNTVIARHR
jgi:hypothetical protein